MVTNAASETDFLVRLLHIEKKAQYDVPSYDMVAPNCIGFQSIFTAIDYLARPRPGKK